MNNIWIHYYYSPLRSLVVVRVLFLPFLFSSPHVFLPTPYSPSRCRHLVVVFIVVAFHACRRPRPFSTSLVPPYLSSSSSLSHYHHHHHHHHYYYYYYRSIEFLYFKLLIWWYDCLRLRRCCRRRLPLYLRFVFPCHWAEASVCVIVLLLLLLLLFIMCMMIMIMMMFERIEIISVESLKRYSW